MLHYLFKPAVAQAGYELVPPLVEDGSLVPATIVGNLESADLILCDITTSNANVFLELGIAVALNKPIAMVKDTYTTAIPFDAAQISCHSYSHRLEQWVTEVEIPKLTTFLRSAGRQANSPLWQYFGGGKKALPTSSTDTLERKLDRVLGELDIIRTQADRLSRLGQAHAGNMDSSYLHWHGPDGSPHTHGGLQLAEMGDAIRLRNRRIPKWEIECSHLEFNAFLDAAKDGRYDGLARRYL